MPLSRNSSGVAVVDDTSHDITYRGKWFTAGVRQEYLITTHGTWQSGSTAIFSFRGSAITVYGTIITGCSSTYVLDDASPVTFTAPNATSVEDIHQFPFYSSPTLQDGVHTLTITQLTNNSRQILWLDYFVYRPSPVQPSILGLPLSPSSLSTPASSPRTNGVHSATIAGYVVGGLLTGLLLSAIVFTLLWRRRRRMTSNIRTNLLADDPPPTTVEPYSLIPEVAPLNASMQPPLYHDAASPLFQPYGPGVHGYPSHLYQAGVISAASSQTRLVSDMNASANRSYQRQEGGGGEKRSRGKRAEADSGNKQPTVVHVPPAYQP